MEGQVLIGITSAIDEIVAKRLGENTKLIEVLEKKFRAKIVSKVEKVRS